ncbi:MAG: NHL repeat-containing protein [Defluviitaleaceae bacterium]|nr:NHL repeat-containing protein [Defluviitaleaceae bacterium]
MRKKIGVLFLACVMFVGSALSVSAEGLPFQGYTYNYWGWIVPTPVAYVPMRSFNGTDIDPELGNFVNPSDVHVCPNGNILVVDTGNNRIVIFDQQLNLIRVIDGFYQDGARQTFNAPQGVFVTQNLEIFVADTENLRVPILDWYGNFLRELETPNPEGLEDDFRFAPVTIAVDRGGRIYVIVRHVFEGIMNFDASGEFMGYFGTIEVGRNPIEIFWRFFMTEHQIARRPRFIPTEFQGMAIDQYNFVFTTNFDAWGTANQVMRLNPRGEDVIFNLNENVTISGDQRHRTMGEMSGPTQLIDVIARPNGMFSALDRTRGRVYTYDSEGNLLYVFSGMTGSGWGTIEGMTRRPVALEMLGDDIIVLDGHQGRILQFTPTEYGALINEAIARRYNGDELGAVYIWRQLVALDANFELAWAGIGRSMLAAGDNAAARYYLRRGMDMVHYSIAFRRHRMEIMQDILPVVFNVATALMGLFIVYKIVKVVKRRVAEA